MKDAHTQWLTTGLVALVAVLTTLFVVRALDDGGSRYAAAQTSEGAASYIVGIVGESQQDDRLPLFLIDTKARSIMVYEYDTGERRLWLRAVRSFVQDRELRDMLARDNNYGSNAGPSVNDVQAMVRKQLKDSGRRRR